MSSLPEIVLSWFVDTAVVFAVQQGTISEDAAVELENPCPE